MGMCGDYEEAFKKLGSAMATVGFSMGLAANAMSDAMSGVSEAVNRIHRQIARSLRKQQIQDLRCGPIDDGIDLEIAGKRLSSAESHDDIMEIFSKYKYPGTILKIFIELDVIEIDKDSRLTIKNKI